MKNKEKIVREFVKAFINKVGMDNTKIILSNVDKKVVLEAIKNGLSKGLDIEHIVRLFVNLSFPPKVILTFEMFGDFNEPNEVKGDIVQILDQIGRIENIEMRSVVVNSFVPYMDDKLIFEGEDMCEDEGCEHCSVKQDFKFLLGDGINNADDNIDGDKDNWIDEWTKKFNE